MSREVTLDFRGVEPASGGPPAFTHVPPGNYPLKIHSADFGTSKGGNNMVTIVFETAPRSQNDEFAGKRLTDYYTIDPVKGEPSFGIRKLMSLLLALGLNVTGQAITLPLDRLPGLMCVGELYDDQMEGTEKYAARTVSKIGQFFALNAAPPPPANGTAAANPAAQPAPPPPPPPAATPAVDPFAQAPAQTAAAQPVAAATTAAPPDSVDSLFN